MKTILTSLLILLGFAPIFSLNGQETVKLFFDSNYRGDYLNVTDEWSVRSSRDPWNDHISSIHIPSGWEVWVYEDSYFRGRHWVLTNSWNGRNNRYWCDRISSIRVVKNRRGWEGDHHCDGRPGRGHRNKVPVTIFEHDHFNGSSKRIYWEWTVEHSNEFWNDRISSIFVPEGYRVIAYEHSYFRGRCLVLENNWSAPRGQNWWNDRISSIRIERI